MEESKKWVCSVPGCVMHAGVEREGRMYCSFHHGTEKTQWNKINNAIEHYKPEIRRYYKGIFVDSTENQNTGGVVLYELDQLIEMVHEYNDSPSRQKSSDGLWGADLASGE